MRTPLWLRDLRYRIGRRGCSLLFFALVDLVYAVGLLAAPAETRAQPTYMFLVAVLPLSVWAVLWGSVGALCAVQAFMLRDRLAFACASWLKVGWGSVHLFGWLIGVVPRGYVSAVIWLAFAGFVQVIATWPEPIRRL